MNFKPLGDRVLVKVKEAETKTASGIIIPDNASKEKPTTATVVAVSGDVEDIKVDDTVMYGKYSGTEVSIDGEDYLVLETSDILGVLA
jgi:chaperonin GroES